MWCFAHFIDLLLDMGDLRFFSAFFPDYRASLAHARMGGRLQHVIYYDVDMFSVYKITVSVG